MSNLHYAEKSRTAQRLFTIDDSKMKLEIFGRFVGRQYSQIFDLKTLFPQPERVVAMRFDAIRRGSLLAFVLFILGEQIMRLNFSNSFLVAWIFWIPAIMSLLAAYKWLRGKEEVATFKMRSGKVAFEIYNDAIGAHDFVQFVQSLASSIDRANQGARPGVSDP